MAEKAKDRFCGLVECADGSIVTRRHYMNGYRSASEVPDWLDLTDIEREKLDSYQAEMGALNGASIA